MGFVEVWIQVPSTRQVDEADLQRFMAGKIEENLNLEYKSVDALKKPDKLSREISAFANSEGGLLLVGVREGPQPRQRPGEIEWDFDEKHTKEWFQDVAVNSIRPQVQGVRIHVVRSKDGSGKIFLVDVPASANPPHMSNGRYYFRNNFETLPMEHYQIADLFGKRRRPILRPTLTVDSFDQNNSSIEVSYKVGNIGHALAKWPMAFMVLRFCTVKNSEDKSMWESIRKVAVEDGMETWNVSHSSPIHVLHQWMEKTLGTVEVQLGEHPAIVSISVGAEDMPTEKYLTIISRKWLIDSNQTPRTEDGRIQLPLVSQTGAFDESEYSRWMETVGASVCDDIEKLGDVNRKNYFNLAFRAVGIDALVLLAKAVEQYPTMSEDLTRSLDLLKSPMSDEDHTTEQ